MSNLDVSRLVLPDVPPEWDVLPRELLAAIKPQTISQVTDQFGKVHYFRPITCFTPEQTRQIDAILAGRWFLLRNIWSWKCYNRKTGKGCKQVHRYFTWGCVERPFNGLTEIVGLMKKEREHARARDLEFSGLALGDIVPITPHKAQELIDRMTMRGYPLNGPVVSPLLIARR